MQCVACSMVVDTVTLRFQTLDRSVSHSATSEQQLLMTFLLVYDLHETAGTKFVVVSRLVGRFSPRLR